LSHANNKKLTLQIFNNEEICGSYSKLTIY
jgi:hypothetical protein